MARRPFTPRAYQTPAINHVLDILRNALWAGMGMGKTVSVLSALDIMYLSGDETRPTLVLAPKRVAQSTWPDEVLKWEHLSGLEIAPIVGTLEERLRALRQDVPIFTMNYENLPWLEEQLKGKWPFGIVVADESTRLKNFRGSQQVSAKGKDFIRASTGMRAKVLAKVAHKHVRRFIELTGTPAPNGLKDLWGQAWFLDAGERLGRTHSAFMQRWFAKSHNGFDVIPHEFAQAQIEARLKDICLSLEAKDYFDLREPIVHDVYVNLPERARRHYQNMEKEMFMQLGEHEVEAFSAATRTIKCLQLANGAAYVGETGEEWYEVHDAKLEALESIIEEAAGMPVLVAYHFKSDLVRLQKAFPKGRVLDSKPQTIRDWNAGKIPVLFAHPQSAGHGLNLQDGGNILVFFSHWWNLEEYQQIIERIGPTRQLQAGHDRPTFIYHIIARDTVDEVVMERRETKREVQDLLMDAMKKKGGA